MAFYLDSAYQLDPKLGATDWVSYLILDAIAMGSLMALRAFPVEQEGVALLQMELKLM